MTKTKTKPVEKSLEQQRAEYLAKCEPTDFVFIRGQETAKRALTVALAGYHSVALVGPTGQGKTMLLKAADAIYTIVANKLVSTEFSLNDIGTRASKRRQHLQFLRDAKAFDLHIEVPKVPFYELTGKGLGTATEHVTKRVIEARKFGLDHTDLTLDTDCQQLLKAAYNELGFTRATIPIVTRIARTIANLDQSDKIQVFNLAEAIQYRLFDRTR